MTLLVVGVVPDETLPLTEGSVARRGDALIVDGREVSRTQGTGAMLGSALAVTTHLGQDPPRALLIGDIGTGAGSRQIYRHLIRNGSAMGVGVTVLHYMLPIMSAMRAAVEALRRAPSIESLIADAGAMYAAKAAGIARQFDVFTPDPGEAGFLADSSASHPAYVQHHLFQMDTNDVPVLMREAYAHGSAPDTVIVKGKIDYIFSKGKIVGQVCEPHVPALEAIGGTGDTITGAVAGFMSSGVRPARAAELAAKCNRQAGLLAQATPAMTIAEVLERFPEVLETHLDAWMGKE